MSYVRCLRGTATGIEYPLLNADGRPPNLDPADGRPLEIVLDLERLKKEQPDFAWYRRQRPDLWRFGALLALDANDPADAKFLVALGEGCTPLREWPEHPLAKSAGFGYRSRTRARRTPIVPGSAPIPRRVSRTAAWRWLRRWRGAPV